MMIKILGCISILLLLGCSQKNDHAIQLENTERENISINILSLHQTTVPKDKFFSNKNWHYKQTKLHKYGYFFDNDEIVETFYLAHHSTHIYIRGNSITIKKYKKYFLKNQVRAKIILIPLKIKRRGEIVIDYFQITPLIAKSINIKNSKSLLPANSKVIEIPNNYIKKD